MFESILTNMQKKCGLYVLSQASHYVAISRTVITQTTIESEISSKRACLFCTFETDDYFTTLQQCMK